MIAADRLREAAKVLRERATDRAVPEGPWFVEDDGSAFHVLANDPAMPGFPWDVARDLPDTDDASPLAEYIATMHPGVGLTLADWLDAQGKHVGSYYCEAQCEPDGCDETKAALRLADLILGGAA